MKKVGVVTINDLNNYGNRLQCYAVQETLKKLELKPENLCTEAKKDKLTTKIKKNIKYIFDIKNERNIYLRKKSFKKFNQLIDYSKYLINEENYKIIDNYYDYFIVGSDQVWNPQFDTTNDYSFLSFADDTKKIAFSASFGVSTLKSTEKEKYRENLSKFKNISVREDSGKDIIENLNIKKDVEVLIDPTLLLSDKEWSTLTRKPSRNNNKKFILNYFLGKMSQNIKSSIDKIAKENDCEVINILDVSSSYYGCGPSEFLWLEKNAFLICTDSFHSCVFSLIFNRPFIIFERDDKYEKMNSRLDTLINKFQLKNRKYNGIEITKENINHDYAMAYKILSEEQQKSENYLKKTLNINTGDINE